MRKDANFTTGDHRRLPQKSHKSSSNPCYRLNLPTGDTSTSQPEIQVPPNRRYKSPPTGDTSFSQPEIQVPPDGRLAPPSIPVPVTAPVPSKITPKTSTETSPESVHPDPENTHTWGPPFKNLDHEIDQELVQKVQFEVLHDTQQESGDKKSNSQGQHCIFMKGNVPGGAGGENLDKMPD